MHGQNYIKHVTEYEVLHLAVTLALLHHVNIGSEVSERK